MAEPETTRQRNGARDGVPRWFRWSMGTLSRAAPPLAVAVAERMFATPPGRRLKPSESAWATEAEAFPLWTARGRVRAWRWAGGPKSVLLVHGWGGRGPQLGAVARRLVEHGYSAITWDMPGHGVETAATSLPELAAVTADVSRRFEPVAGVVAHSFGTAVTVAATARYGMRLPRLVVVSPAARLEKVADLFAHATGFTPEVVERMRDRLADRLDFEWEALDAATVAPRLDAPTLIVHDQGDERVPFEEGVELARLLPRAELLATDGLGHSGPLRDPGVLQRIARFFSG